MASRKSRRKKSPPVSPSSIPDASSSVADQPSSLPPKDSGLHFTLSDCDGKRVAVSLSTPGGIRILSGQASWTHDPTLGKVLKITFGDEGETGASSMLIAPEEWHGEVLPGSQHACEFLIRLTHTP